MKNHFGFILFVVAALLLTWTKALASTTSEVHWPEESEEFASDYNEYRENFLVAPLEPYAFPSDWDLQWQMTSGEAFYSGSQIIFTQPDEQEDPEFEESRMGFLFPIHETQFFRDLTGDLGISFLLGWMTMPIRSYDCTDCDFQLKYLVRIPLLKPFFRDKLYAAMNISQYRSVSTVWNSESQIGYRVFDNLSALVRFGYSDWEDEKWRKPWLGVQYIAEF